MARKLLISLSLLVFLSGCYYSAVDFRKFPAIKKSCGFYDLQDDIVVAIKALDPQESKNTFGLDLTSKGYIPLLLRIENRSSDILIIRPSYLNISIVDPAIIAKLLHWDTSFYIMTAGSLALLFFWPATYWVGKNGYEMYRDNRRINSTVNQLSLHENQPVKILPYEVLCKYIFVNKYEFINSFNLRIFNKTKRKLLNFFVNI